MPLDDEGIFKIVAKRIKEKQESLRQLKQLEQVKRKTRSIGIEGWLKVEAIAALGDKVKSVNGIGPDLDLVEGIKIELKAATNFDPDYIKKGATKYKTPCIFLGDANDKKIHELKNSDKVDIDILDIEPFGDDGNKWVIGIIKPKPTSSLT